MICEFLYFIAPCYDLVHRYQPDQLSNVSQNSSYFLSCKTRCEGLNRKLPSYAMIKELDLDFMWNTLLANRSTCTFPVDVSYDKGACSIISYLFEKTTYHLKYVIPSMTLTRKLGSMDTLKSKYLCHGKIQHHYLDLFIQYLTTFYIPSTQIKKPGSPTADS